MDVEHNKYQNYFVKYKTWSDTSFDFRNALVINFLAMFEIYLRKRPNCGLNWDYRTIL